MTDDSPKGRSLFQKSQLYVLLGIAVAAIIVIFQNMKDVETQILFFKITMPQAALLAGTTLAGFAAGILWSSFRRR